MTDNRRNSVKFHRLSLYFGVKTRSDDVQNPKIACFNPNHEVPNVNVDVRNLIVEVWNVIVGCQNVEFRALRYNNAR